MERQGTMKFLHTSDLHIGKTVCGFSMLEEQNHALEQMLDIVRTERVDMVFLCGDLYDRALPPSQAVTMLDEFLTALVDMGVVVCAIAGNHDSGERIGFASRILEHKGLYMEGVLKKQIRYVDWGKHVRVHLVPYARPVQVRDVFGAEVTDYEDSMREILKHVELLENGSNILLTHQFVVNHGVAPELSDSETRVSVGGADQVEVCNFAAFDYVALGHIHGPQQIGSGPVCYSGSPVKYSFSEVYHKKSVVVGELDGETGQLTMKRVSLKPVHDMRKIRGKLAELITPEVAEAADAQDYLLAVLTNEEELVDPIGTLRSVYPNVMQLQIERAEKERIQEQQGMDWREKSPLELFEQFYGYVTDQDLSEEQRELIQNVIVQAKEELE